MAKSALAQEAQPLLSGLERAQQAAMASLHHTVIAQPGQAGLGQYHGTVRATVQRGKPATDPARDAAGDLADLGITVPLCKAFLKQRRTAPQRPAPAALRQPARRGAAAEPRHTTRVTDRSKVSVQSLQRDQSAQAMRDHGGHRTAAQTRHQLRYCCLRTARLR